MTSNFTPQTFNFKTRLPINIKDLLRQRKVEGERIEYKAEMKFEVRRVRCERYF